MPNDNSAYPQTWNGSVPSHRERRLHETYEWIHILNDSLSSLFFVIGSVFFFYPSMQDYGTWLFLIGSIQMLVGPMIRIANKLHVRNIRKELIHW